jgi:signal transduction histidine kinase
VSGAALTLRRRHPLPVAALVAGALLIFAVRGYPGGPLLLAVMVVLYTVGASLGRRRALVAGGVAVVLVAGRSVAVIAAEGGPSPFSWAAPGWVLACLLAGMLVRSRRQAVQAQRDRAQQTERVRAEQARTRVVQERLRIARDLHDVVGHTFAAVHVQARVAAALMETDPAGARRALAAIEATSRDALHEIRATLGVVRSDPAALLIGSPADLDKLLAPARAADLRVHTTVDLDAPLPSSIATVVYRVIQEALTNVLKHASATTVGVTVARDGDGVRVEVRDDGCGQQERDDPARSGLAGMAERIAAVGGRLDAGPVAGPGWRVVGWIPWRAEAG